jgi:hypothetical protein
MIRSRPQMILRHSACFEYVAKHVQERFSWLGDATLQGSMRRVLESDRIRVRSHSADWMLQRDGNLPLVAGIHKSSCVYSPPGLSNLD